MLNEVVGFVCEAESGLGIDDVPVSALVLRDVNGEFVCCECLGEARTDKRGQFRICVSADRCAATGYPDAHIVIEVRKPGSREPIKTERRRIAGETRLFYKIKIGRDQLEELSPSSGVTLGRKRERLSVSLRCAEGKPIEARKLLLLTPHRSNAKRQYRAEMEGTADFELDVPPGSYTVQVFAAGHEVANGLAEVAAGKPLDLSFAVKPRDSWRVSAAERLAVYGLKEGAVDTASISVADGESVDLRLAEQRNYQPIELEADSMASLQRFLGARQSVFAHDRPKFGAPPLINRELIAEQPRVATLPGDTRRDLELIAHEYLHGNAQAVAQFEPVLDRYLAELARFIVPLWLFKVVTIHANATLTVGGAGSTVFYADVLRIHPTGHLQVAGNCKLDIGRWEKY